MDYSNIVTFIINNKQYHLYYDLVKSLPIFEELKKSDKVETIEYPGEINYNEIATVFDVITERTVSERATYKSIFRMIDFMKYLLVDDNKIKKFIENNFDAHYYSTNLEAVMEFGNYKEICTMLPCSEVSMYNMVEYIKNKSNSKEMKIIILKSFMINIPNICGDCFTTCVLSGKHYFSNHSLSSLLRIIGIGNNKISGKEANNLLLDISIDGNKVELINVTIENGFYNITESIINFTEQYLLKFIEQ